MRPGLYGFNNLSESLEDALRVDIKSFPLFARAVEVL